MAENLPLPHRSQQADGYCLPACVQMVLAHFGFFHSQEALGKALGVNPLFGVPHSNIKKLSSLKLKVVYEPGTLEDIHRWLNQNIPVIVFVQAGDLPHWLDSHFQHAIVVVGLEGQTFYIMDPALDAGPTAVDEESFMLAWSGMDYYYATLVP